MTSDTYRIIELEERVKQLETELAQWKNTARELYEAGMRMSNTVNRIVEVMLPSKATWPDS